MKTIKKQIINNVTGKTVKYRHLGDVREELGTFIKTPGFSFAHFKINNGNATICGGLVEDGNLYYGISFCSPVDNFSKRKGRALAKIAMIKQSDHCRGVYQKANKDERAGQLLKEALQNHLTKMRNKPSWIKTGVLNVEFNSKKRS